MLKYHTEAVIDIKKVPETAHILSLGADKLITISFSTLYQLRAQMDFQAMYGVVFADYVRRLLLRSLRIYAKTGNKLLGEKEMFLLQEL